MPECGVHALHISKGFIKQSLISPRKPRIVSWHVVREVHDCTLVNGRGFENSIRPGTEMSGSLILTQKLGDTDRFNLKTRQQIPIFLIASYSALHSAGRSGTIAETSGVGIVEITASASTTPFGVATPVTDPSLVVNSSAGHLRRISRSRGQRRAFGSRLRYTQAPLPSSSYAIFPPGSTVGPQRVIRRPALTDSKGD